MAAFFANTTLGSYVSHDSIEHLMLRVALRRRAGPGEAPVDCAEEARPAERAASLAERLMRSAPSKEELRSALSASWRGS